MIIRQWATKNKITLPKEYYMISNPHRIPILRVDKYECIIDAPIRVKYVLRHTVRLME